MKAANNSQSIVYCPSEDRIYLLAFQINEKENVYNFHVVNDLDKINITYVCNDIKSLVDHLNHLFVHIDNF